MTKKRKQTPADKGHLSPPNKHFRGNPPGLLAGSYLTPSITRPFVLVIVILCNIARIFDWFSGELVSRNATPFVGRTESKSTFPLTSYGPIAGKTRRTDWFDPRTGIFLGKFDPPRRAVYSIYGYLYRARQTAATSHKFPQFDIAEMTQTGKLCVHARVTIKASDANSPLVLGNLLLVASNEVGCEIFPRDVPNNFPNH